MEEPVEAMRGANVTREMANNSQPREVTKTNTVTAGPGSTGGLTVKVTKHNMDNIAHGHDTDCGASSKVKSPGVADEESISDTSLMRDTATPGSHFNDMSEPACIYVDKTKKGVTATDLRGAKCAARELSRKAVLENGPMPTGVYLTVGSYPLGPEHLDAGTPLEVLTTTTLLKDAKTEDPEVAKSPHSKSGPINT